MRFGYSEVCLAHDTGGRHPEGPDRLRAIRAGLTQRHSVEYVEAEPATFDEVAAVHDRGYLESLRDFCENGGGRWDPDTIAVERTWDSVLHSAGLARWAAIEAAGGADGRRTPFALGRPPGHHAVVDDAMGFCFVNNVCVAAEAALGSTAVDRIGVLDWDVHHGNGTQDIFYGRGDVCYASIHEDGLYPGTGAVEETGEGAGEGATVNVPLPAGGGDPEYLAAIDRVVVPAFERFDPDLILISTGFDAHRHDPISRMRVSIEGFGCFTDRLRGLATDLGAGLGFVLEGGYSLDMLAEGVGIVHEVFDGRVPVEAEGDVDERVDDLLGRVRAVHGLGSK